MKHLKFRYYDKKTNSFTYSDELPFRENYKQLEVFFAKALLYGETVEQYIGECDMVGRELYEGDIIKLKSWAGHFQIGFVEGAFCMCDENGHYAGDIHYIHHAGRPQAMLVGNVHMNPGKLKEE